MSLASKRAQHERMPPTPCVLIPGTCALQHSHEAFHRGDFAPGRLSRALAAVKRARVGAAPDAVSFACFAGACRADVEHEKSNVHEELA